MNTKKFISADISTNFIDEEYKDGFTGAVLSDEEEVVILCAAVHIHMNEMKRAATISNQLRFASKAIGTRWVVRMNDRNYPVAVRAIEDGYKISFENRRFYISSRWLLGGKLFQCSINGADYSLQIEYIRRALYLTFKGSKTKVSMFTPRAGELNKYMKQSSKTEIEGNLLANISGIIVDVKVKLGDEVTKDQPLIILEAMKMENVLVSPLDGKVVALNTTKGAICAAGDVLAEIEPLN